MTEVELLEDRTQLTPMTYAATDLPLQVPPGDPDATGTTVSTIHVADDFVVQDVNVQINIEHTFDSDLQVVLIAPDGTRVELFSGIGDDGDNFTDTILDQQSDQSIADASAPFTGTFRPTADLSSFNGQYALGDWQLEVTDTFEVDSGTLQSWSLTLDDAVPSVPSDVIIELTPTPGVYSLTVVRAGAVTISLSAADGSRFIGEVALLTPDFRPLVERAFPDDSTIAPVMLTELVGSGAYLLRVQSRTLASAEPLLQAQFVPASNPGLPISVGSAPFTVQVVDVNGDGSVDLVTPNLDTNDVSVLLGRSDGTFEVQRRFAAGDSPLEVQVVDVNGDRHVDLVILNFGTDDISLLVGRGDGTFENQRRFAVGDSPQAVRVMDVNGDGRVDLVTSNVDSNDVSMLLGRGDGTFEEQRRFAVGDSPQTVQVVDVNGDGHVDLVTPNLGTFDVTLNDYIGGDDVSVLLGRGDGMFEDQRRFAVGNSPLETHVVDVNGDGRIDLVTLNLGRYNSELAQFFGSNVSVLLGLGDGTFADERHFDVGRSPQSVQVLDVNGDGRVDVVTPNLFSHDVSVLLGLGDGTFGSESRLAVGDGPRTVQVLDVDDDGHIDFVTSNSFSNDVSILLGRRDGTFAGERRFEVGKYPFTVQVMDVNRDGRVDLVTPNYFSNDVSVLQGRGDGTFANQRRFAVGDQPETVQVVDVNGDGRVDLVTPNFLSDDVSVLLGRGDGTFETERLLAVGRGPNMVQELDVNSDGRVDLVTSNVGSDDVSVLLGRGDGTFEAQSRFVVGDTPRTVLMVDVNRDGHPDLVTPNENSDDVSVLLGRGDGTFETQRRFVVGDSPRTVQVVDVNRDGHPDLVTPNLRSDDVSVLLSRGDGTFETQRRVVVGNAPQAVQVVDLNGDSRVDLVTTNVLSDDVSVLLGRGDGTFETQRRFVVGDYPETVEELDVNGDGRVDLVTANRMSDDVSVLLGRGDGTFETQRRFTVGVSPETVQVVDVNGDGRVDLVTPNFDTSVDTNDVSVLLGRGDGTFEAQRRFVVGDGSGTVEVVDVNGDGRVDLVTPNVFSDDVSVLLGNGQSDFVNALSVAPITVGARPVVEDINGDGIDDVLLLRQDGAVLYRQGTRTSLNGPGQSVATSLGEFGTAVVLNPEHPARDFTLLRSLSGLQIATLETSGSVVSLYQWGASATLAQGSFRLTGSVTIVGSIPARIASGNFDLDVAGRDDFVLINQGTQTVVLYLADAIGFHPTETFDAGAGPVSLTTTDLNRDGLTDFIVPNFGSGDVSVFTNIGDGHFATSLFRTGPGPYFIGPSPHDASRIESQSFEETSSAEVGDFNRDGLPDVIATNPGSNSWSILSGTTLGLSSDPVITLLGNSPSRFAAVRVADINHDGHDDAVFLNESGTQLSVFLNAADANGLRSLQLTRTMDLPTPLTGFILHDANDDDLPDVFATNEFGDLLLLLNQGDGRFAEDRQADRRIPIAVQDLNGDGQPDVVLANQGLDQVSIAYGGATHPTALQELASSDDGVAAPGAVKLADLNGDGVVDLIVPNTGGNSVLIYKGHVGANGRGDGTFETGEAIFTGSNPASVTVSDLDHDGRMDLVVTNRGSNTVAVFYGQAAADSQTVSGATSIPFRAGALSRLPSGSGPVDSQVVNLPNPDGSMQTGLVVTNSTSNSVSFIPSAGNGIFNATPSNTVPLGFSPLPGAIVNNILVLPNPNGNNLGFLSLSAGLFAPGEVGISFSERLNRPVGIDASDVNQDGFLDLLVANNGDGSFSLLLGGGNGFDFFQTYLLDGITHASALQVAGFELYVTEEGRDFFTVFDLADLLLANGDQILDFEAISSGLANTVTSPNRPIYGVGLFSPLLLALFGQFPLEEGEARNDGQLSNEPASWQSLTLLVTQMTQQFDRLSETLGGALWVSMLETLSTDLGLPKLSNQQTSRMTFEALVTPLGILSGTQPLTQLVRTLRSLRPTRPNAPANRPVNSSTPPATKPPLKVPLKTAPAQTSAMPNHFRSRSRETSVRTLTSSATSGTFAVPTSLDIEPTELTKYMTQLSTSPRVASDLFDRQPPLPPEVLLEPTADNFETEAAASWPVFAWSAAVSPALAELGPHRLRKRRLQNMIVG